MAYLGNQLTITGTQNNKRLSTTATASQTDFTVAGGYAINQIDVYRNGVKLNNQNDFTASDGSTVVLTQGATGGDVIEFVIYENFDVADVINTTGNQTIDGNLTVVDLTARHINSSGFTTATSFSGSGSGLTGVSTNFVSAIGIQSGGTVIGAGITQLNFIGAGNTFAVNGTTVDISIQGGGGGGGITSLDITSSLFI
tara:strand:- start:382 stop:975 length:594 start_codon:yes stop_codon:yes gene_type:complete